MCANNNIRTNANINKWNGNMNQTTNFIFGVLFSACMSFERIGPILLAQPNG